MPCLFNKNVSLKRLVSDLSDTDQDLKYARYSYLNWKVCYFMARLWFTRKKKNLKIWHKKQSNRHEGTIEEPDATFY